MSDMKDTEECDHGIAFDEEEWRRTKRMSRSEVRKRWPRFNGHCARCGYTGIYYASFAHYVAGDW